MIFRLNFTIDNADYRTLYKYFYNQRYIFDRNYILFSDGF